MSDPVHHRADRPDDPVGDLARALPSPPPPRPAQQFAAIAAALERFDIVGMPSFAARPAPAARPPARWRPSRVQVAAFASIALVALIAAPLSLQHSNSLIESPPSSIAPQAVDKAPAKSDRSSPPEAVAASRFKPRTPQDAPAAVAITPSRSNSPDEPVAAARTVELASIAPAPLAVPPPPPAPASPAASVAPEALADASGALQRSRVAEDGRSDIVVTGSRISHRAEAAAGRGDWNACTVADPEHSLRGCRAVVHAGGKGPAGAAGVQVEQGLALSWQEDWSGAVAAFDRALVLRPHLGIAYLNRGLANERLGASDQALADLNLAVRYDPSARSYYVRSQARRVRGDIRGARSDENRAIELDPDYARAIPN